MKKRILEAGITLCGMALAVVLWSCGDKGRENPETAQAAEQAVQAEQPAEAESVQPEAAQAAAQPPAQTAQSSQTVQNTIPYETGELVFFMNDSKLNVRESPNKSAKVVFQLDRTTDVSTLELTAWKDTIDGRRDRWVKIKMEDGRTGWVFGGFLGAERGGPKFYVEEDIQEWEEMMGDEEIIP
jgi:hypothetical protein